MFGTITKLKEKFFSPPEHHLVDNYRTHGADLGCPGYDEFIHRALEFYHEVHQSITEGISGYTRVELNKQRIVLDYNSQIRGIYARDGRPIAFFRPNFRMAGFATAEEELAALKHRGPVVRA